MSDFELARQVLRQAERLIVGSKAGPTPEGRWAIYSDSAFAGPSLVAAGARILLVRFGITVLVAVTFFIYFVAMDRHGWARSILPAFGYAVLAVYFGLPSRTAAAGVSAAQVVALGESIQDIAPTPEALARLDKGLAILRSYKLDRLARFSGLAALGWGALFWYATSHIFAVGLDASKLGDTIGRAILAAVAFILVLGVASAHSAGVRAVHQTIEFGLLEAERLQYLTFSTESASPEPGGVSIVEDKLEAPPDSTRAPLA